MRYLVSILLFVLATSACATDRKVFNNVEKNEGYPLSSGTKVVVFNDSMIWVHNQNDVGQDNNINYANGTGVAFSQAFGGNGWDLGEAYEAWSLFEFQDTVYTFLNHTSTHPARVYKQYVSSGLPATVIDTMTGITLSFGFGAVGTDGTNFVGYTKSNSTNYFNAILTLAARVGGATGWTLVDSTTSAVTVQHNMMAAPVQGGILVIDHDQDEAHLIEADGTKNEDALGTVFGNLKQVSTGRVGGQTFYDASLTAFDTEGQGDTVLAAMVESTDNRVWVFMLVTDSSGGSVTLADSIVVSAVGQKTNMADTAGMRTPTITMAGDGFFIYYRDWADTTDLTATRISYHIATDRSDLSTIGSRITLDTDSATSTMGEIMAPADALVHNNTDSLYLYAVWQREDGASSLIATYEAVGKPSATPPAVAVGSMIIVN